MISTLFLVAMVLNHFSPGIVGNAAIGALNELAPILGFVFQWVVTIVVMYIGFRLILGSIASSFKKVVKKKS